MTQTEERPASTGTPEPSAQDRAEAWFAAFEDALKARDVARAASMFATTSFWRDLIAFTWNLKTVENPDGVADLLQNTLDTTDPSGFRLTEPADEADGVVTAWFEFETGVGRGTGLLRLVEEDGADKAWTFLTTLHELKGHEEPRHDRRPMGAEHGIDKDRQTWLEKRQAEASRWARPSSPTCW